MPRIPRATRELQWQGQWAPTPRGEGNPQTLPQLGSGAATRPREHGMPSNRVSSPRGEYVPAPCTHRPSLHPSGARTRPGPPWPCRIRVPRGGRSRNKVAVGEPAAGSPPKKPPKAGWRGKSAQAPLIILPFKIFIYNFVPTGSADGKLSAPN